MLLYILTVAEQVQIQEYQYYGMYITDLTIYREIQNSIQRTLVYFVSEKITCTTYKQI